MHARRRLRQDSDLEGRHAACPNGALRARAWSRAYRIDDKHQTVTRRAWRGDHERSVPRVISLFGPFDDDARTLVFAMENNELGRYEAEPFHRVKDRFP